MFKVVLPKTGEELKKYYQFRYKVMCDELKHIPKNKDCIDLDHHDKYSLHLMAIDNQNNIVATMRIIYNSPNGLPTPSYMHINNTKKEFIPQESTCEISRVFVDNDIRSPNNTKQIIYKLVAQVYIYAKKNNIKFFYAALEKKFIRLLKILKINFTIIGKQEEFYGLRYPCIISDKELFKHNPYIN